MYFKVYKILFKNKLTFFKFWKGKVAVLAVKYPMSYLYFLLCNILYETPLTYWNFYLSSQEEIMKFWRKVGFKDLYLVDCYFKFRISNHQNV